MGPLTFYYCEQFCLSFHTCRYENCAAETVHAIRKYLTLDEIPNYPLPPRPKSILNLKESPPDSPKNKGHAPPDGVQTRLLTRNANPSLATASEANNNVYSHHVAEYLLNQVSLFLLHVEMRSIYTHCSKNKISKSLSIIFSIFHIV